ncbi:hypothetical protein QJT78_50290, partial [Bradyrhizobium sp. Mp27]|nr:hypothetical protein [Bradyrhizobium sp. Mp27]
TSASMTRWKPLWTLIPGSRLDADHPENGVLIPCRNTRKPLKLGAIALANKLARIAWKLMVSRERYRPASSVMPMPTET